jgi:hypothetical protein
MRFVSEITIDHLLTHTIGGWPNGRGDPMFSNNNMNYRELIAWTLENLPLADPPAVNSRILISAIGCSAELSRKSLAAARRLCPKISSRTVRNSRDGDRR